MKKVVLLSALALVVGAGLLRLLQHDTGYVLIEAFGKTIEMRLGFALIMLLLSVLALMLVWRILRGIKNTLTGGYGWVRNGRSRRAESRTRRGMLRYLEGDWRAARRDLVKGAKGSQAPLVNYLAAARSAYELGDVEGARGLIEKAESRTDGDELAVALSQARLQIFDRKYEASLATLHRCKELYPHHPVVLDLLRQVYVALRDWRALESLLPELERQRVLPIAELRGLTEQVYLGQLEELARRPLPQSTDEQDPASSAAELHAIWERVPKKFKHDAVFIEAYARLLLQAKQDEEGETLLRATLKRQWSQPLIDLYGLAQTADKPKQLQQVQAWLKDHPNDARLHLACGRVMLRNEMWAAAREHFAQSLQLNPSPEAYAELGRLLAYMGEHEQSTGYFQRGLMMTSRDLPNLVAPS